MENAAPVWSAVRQQKHAHTPFAFGALRAARRAVRKRGTGQQVGEQRGVLFREKGSRSRF